MRVCRRLAQFWGVASLGAVGVDARTVDRMTQASSGDGPNEQLVDWDLAAATATRLIRPGPEVSRDQAAALVAELRDAAQAAQGHVAAYTGLSAPPAVAPVVVVDRAGWAKANVAALSQLITPLLDKVKAKRPQRQSSIPIFDQIGPKVTGVETGALLAFLAGKVLGQFDPYHVGEDGERGRLLLVAPNVLAVERELSLDPSDFRLWVCLHEETHRVQFGAVPWLGEHLRGQIAQVLEATELDASALANRLRDVVEHVIRSAKEDDGRSILDIVQTPEQKEIVDRITGIMSLLEGHADVVMDGVGPDVVPTVAAIRRRFQARRQGAKGTDKMLRRLLGLDAKMRQYRDGATFVRGVVDRVGIDGFNRVWESPEQLPTLAEITRPDAWVERVHGAAA